MENASKALIIAGAILISIIIISLGVVIFSNMSGSVKNNTSLDEQAKQSFNSRLTKYIGKNVSGSQVNALIQVARTINQKSLNEQNTMQRITITGVGTVSISGNDVVYKNVPTGKFYTVLGQYDQNGLITLIEISEN